MSVFEQYNTSASPILFPVGERATFWKNNQSQLFIPANTHKALVRQMPDGQPHLLNIVGASYKLVHNRELFSAIEDTIERVMPAEMLVDPTVRDKVSHWGRTCFREYVFPATRTKLDSFSQVAFRLIVQNGYGGSGLRTHSGAIDFFCTNGMIRGDYASTYNKHTAGLTISNFTNVIEDALRKYEEAKPVWLRWTQTKVPFASAMQLFKDLAKSDKLAQNLSDQYVREREVHGDTVWGVYSTMTHYASHNDGEFSLRKSTNEQDSVANTMLARELRVADWVQSPEWAVLEAA